MIKGNLILLVTGLFFIIAIITIIVIIVHSHNKNSTNSKNSNEIFCDASKDIENGNALPCTSYLADGATCNTTCNSGYTLSGNRSCKNGTLTDTAKCVTSVSSGCSGGISMSDQPENTVQIINNTSESPFHVFLEYSNMNLVGDPPTPKHPSLDKPDSKWTIQTSSKGVNLGDPVQYYPQDKIIPGVTGKTFPPVAIGSGTWQELIMPNRGDSAILKIPNFTKGQPWSVRPLKYKANNQACGGSEEDCGMPILIESGKDMVGDMSAVDGVNFLLCYELTAKDGSTVMDFKTNPCRAVGRNPKGCTNPSVDGIFNSSLVGTSQCLPDSPHCWLSAPCPAGTCNLTGVSKAWCDAINDGQCANSSSQWSKEGQGNGGPESCAKHNMFTTYCYSHNDATSSPYFSAPYKMKLVYSDLV